MNRDEMESAKRKAIEQRVMSNPKLYSPDLYKAAFYSDGFDDGWDHVNKMLINALESISGAVNLDYAIRRANEALAGVGVSGYAED